ncbi:MAG: DUF481 domain-containing protein [Thermoguttaceae bacterium]
MSASTLAIFLGISICTAWSENGPNDDAAKPLIPPAAVERLPPVGNAEAPTDWVAKPQFDDFLLSKHLASSLAHETEQNKPEQNEIVLPGEEIVAPLIKLWEGSFSVGLDGAEGNNEAMNLHVGFNAKRKTQLHLLYLDLDYNRRTAYTVNTANRLFSEARYERLIQKTPWSAFVETMGEYDEFQDFDFRITLHGGLGYSFFQTPKASLRGRFGSGCSHEIGGPKDKYYAPEMIVGADYERQISARQKLVATIDYMPDESDFAEFRLNTLAGWEFTLDQATHLGLRLAVRNRYDSSPGTALPNDLDYAALLLWKF